MSAFATPAQMENRTGGLIAATHPFLSTELDAATEAIRRYCGWHNAALETVRYRRVRSHPEQVWLPAMQIDEITEATIDGETIDPETIEVDPDTGWTSLCARRVDIKFKAGFNPVPADLVTLTLELAAAALGSPLGISREQTGGVSVTFTRVSGQLLVNAGGQDIPRLAPYRLGWLP